MIVIRHTEDHDDEIAALDAACFTRAEAYPVQVLAVSECWVALDGREVMSMDPRGSATIRERLAS